MSFLNFLKLKINFDTKNSDEIFKNIIKNSFSMFNEKIVLLDNKKIIKNLL